MATYKQIEEEIEAIINESEDYIGEEIALSEQLAAKENTKASGYSAFKTKIIHEIASMIDNKVGLEHEVT
mgnify:CR=1 FL=1